MVLTVEDFDGHVALDTVQLLQSRSGTGWLSGCAPNLVATDTAVTIDVASGTVVVQDTETSVTNQQIALDDGDGQWPRKDVVYVDDTGSLGFSKGNARGAKPPDATDRHTYQPEPSDLKDLANGPNSVVPIAEVWMPPGASGESDLSNASVTYVRDRRLRPWGESVLTDATGVDADTVDGYHGTELGALAEAETVTAGWDFTGGLTKNGASVYASTAAAEAIADPDADTFAVAAGDDYIRPIFVPDGDTITIYAWGLNLTDGTTDASVVLEFNDPAGTTVGTIDASASPNYAENTAGIHSYANSSGGAQVAHLRLANTGTTEYTPSGTGVGIERTIGLRVE